MNISIILLLIVQMSLSKSIYTIVDHQLNIVVPANNINVYTTDDNLINCTLSTFRVGHYNTFTSCDKVQSCKFGGGYTDTPAIYTLSIRSENKDGIIIVDYDGADIPAIVFLLIFTVICIIIGKFY